MKADDVEYQRVRPTAANAPDTCEYGDCSSTPEQIIQFEEPAEFMCYCREHAHQMYATEHALEISYL